MNEIYLPGSENGENPKDNIIIERFNNLLQQKISFGIEEFSLKDIFLLVQEAKDDELLDKLMEEFNNIVTSIIKIRQGQSPAKSYRVSNVLFEIFNIIFTAKVKLSILGTKGNFTEFFEYCRLIIKKHPSFKPYISRLIGEMLNNMFNYQGFKIEEVGKAFLSYKDVFNYKIIKDTLIKGFMLRYFVSSKKLNSIGEFLNYMNQYLKEINSVQNKEYITNFMNIGVPFLIPVEEFEFKGKKISFRGMELIGISTDKFRSLKDDFKKITALTVNEFNGVTPIHGKRYIVGHIESIGDHLGIRLTVNILHEGLELNFDIHDFMDIVKYSKITKSGGSLYYDKDEKKTYIIFTLKNGEIIKIPSISYYELSLENIREIPKIYGTELNQIHDNAKSNLDSPNKETQSLRNKKITNILRQYGINIDPIEFDIKNVGKDKLTETLENTYVEKKKKKLEIGSILKRVLTALNSINKINLIQKVYISRNQSYIVFIINGKTIFIPFGYESSIFIFNEEIELKDKEFDTIKEIESIYSSIPLKINDFYKGDLWDEVLLTDLGLYGNFNYKENLIQKTKDLINQGVINKDTLKGNRSNKTFNENGLKNLYLGKFIEIIGGNQYIKNYVGSSEYMLEYIKLLLEGDKEKIQSLEETIKKGHIPSEQVKSFLDKIKSGEIILSDSDIKNWGTPEIKEKFGVPHGIKTSISLIINLGGDPKESQEYIYIRQLIQRYKKS